MIVVHEIFGVNDWVLAENGFVALVPDLVSGLGPNGGGTTSVASRHQVIGLLRGLNQDEKFARLAAVRDYAATLPSTTGLVAVVGFRWGGSSAFSYAMATPDLQAAVATVGLPLNQPSISWLRCPCWVCTVETMS